MRNFAAVSAPELFQTAAKFEPASLAQLARARDL